MKRHRKSRWLVLGVFLFVVVLGPALGSPARVVGQDQTPTLVPPPPRTLPPGIRSTPEPTPVPPVDNTPAPPGEPGTPEPIATPVALLPVSGGSTSGTNQIFYLVLALGGLGLLAVGLRLARPSRTE
jgi:hypothetical protein